MKRILILLLLLPFVFVQFARAAPKKAKPADTPPNEIVAEYIRSLSAVHEIQSRAKNENENPRPDVTMMTSLMNAVRNFTSFKIEMNTSITALKRMKATKNKDTKELLETTIKLYQQKYNLFDESVKNTQKVMNAATGDIKTITKIAGRAPEITAQIDYIDETLYKMMPLVYAVLLDSNHAKSDNRIRLYITKERRDDLVQQINNGFGDSLNQESPTWIFGSAAMLQKYLMLDFVPADEGVDKWGHLWGQVGLLAICQN